jgi:hypothetical protein
LNLKKNDITVIKDNYDLIIKKIATQPLKTKSYLNQILFEQSLIRIKNFLQFFQLKEITELISYFKRN